MAGGFKTPLTAYGTSLQTMIFIADKPAYLAKPRALLADSASAKENTFDDDLHITCFHPQSSSQHEPINKQWARPNPGFRKVSGIAHPF